MGRAALSDMAALDKGIARHVKGAIVRFAGTVSIPTPKPFVRSASATAARRWAGAPH